MKVTTVGAGYCQARVSSARGRRARKSRLALVSNDGEVYRHFCPSTSKAMFLSIQDLTDALSRHYDVVNLFCDVPASGIVTDNIGNTITVTELIQKCCDSGVKLLWIASNNQPDGYIKGFGACQSAQVRYDRSPFSVTLSR